MSYVRLHASLARVVLSRFPFLCLYWSNTVCNFSFLRSVYICAHVSFLRMFSDKKCCPRVFFTASRFDMVHLYKVSSINKYIQLHTVLDQYRHTNGKRARMTRAKQTSRQSETRQTGTRQTDARQCETRQTGM